jgi:hydrogenase maturation protein HypF
LFDAVAAIIGVRDQANYEGQAAIELEQMADVDERGAYRAGVSGSAPVRISGADLVAAVLEDMRARVPRETVAARFHNGIAQAICEVCAALRDREGLGIVALSGGVFQNALLLERVSSGLKKLGFAVLTHSRVPANDGGISLGQAAIACARDYLSD